MSVGVMILSCDRYEPYWRGLWNFMGKQWDFSIDAPIRLFNEETRTEAPSWCEQKLVGKGTFVENLRRAVSMVPEDDLFLMLEDFWPIAPMTRTMFEGLHREFRENDLDALQVSNYTPYYSVQKSGRRLLGRELMDFAPESDWIFNFQARFWKRESLLKFLVEPELSEKAVGSAITAEMAADKLARESKEFRVRLFHYLWYPLSGVSYRGQLTEFGQQLQNIVEIDDHVERVFSQQDASSSRQECSA